jgi:hypothetical protein
MDPDLGTHPPEAATILGCAGETGAVSRMKESNSKGVANHAGPESWVDVREGEGQALTGGRVGVVIEPRKTFPHRVCCGFWSADLFQGSGRQHRRCRSRKVSKGSTRSKNQARTDAPRQGTGRSHDRLHRADRIGKSEDSSR